jgi:GntR family transcriptional regulator, transcriptional repressor for pyruvate dehydrogenase complex
VKPVFEPISDNVALSKKIVAQITDAIVRGELRTGSRLPPERDLAVQFQVSRTAIRDAVKILSGKGVLMVKHGVGIFVAPGAKAASGATSSSWVQAWGVYDGNIRDLFEIRKTLETQAAYLAAERADEGNIHRLALILRDAQSHGGDLQVLNDRDAQFHVAIAEASQNLMLVQVMWTLLDVLAEGRQESLRIPNRPQASLEEHEEIYQAIAMHHADRAKAAMFNHLGSVEEAIVNRKEE